MVNLTQALADEWAESGVRVNCVNPERTGTPMRTKAFGEEPADSLLDSRSVAQASLDVLLSDGTGHVLDLRKLDPMADPVDAAGPRAGATVQAASPNRSAAAARVLA